MAFGKLAAVAVFAAASVGAASASTFTFNDGDAYCVPAGNSAPCADGNDGTVEQASMLAANSVFGFISPSFVDALGQSFAARVTVVATGTPSNRPAGEPAPSYTSNTVSGHNSWYRLRFEFVESFDIATRTFGADRSIAGLQHIIVDDIDSNAGVGLGANFTDVAAVNAPLVPGLLGSRLETGGFIDKSNDVGSLPTTGDGFNYVRLIRTGDGNNDGIADWIAAPNVPANAPEADKAAVRAVYDATGLSDGFEFVWGSTSDVDFFRNTRGWNLSLVAPPAIPLPASLPLLLGAIAGVALLKRRRRTA